MALTVGTGPFGERAAGTFNFTREGPAHVLYLEESPKRIRGMFGGETVVDSTNATLLYETEILPVYYFPRADVRMELLTPTDHSSTCPFKGDASYWSIAAGDRTSENAVWSYAATIDSCPPIDGSLAFYWRKLDAWFEEDEEVFVHPRDPYHRIDVLTSSRQVKISRDGIVLAESSRPVNLFETGLPPRYYLPADDVRMELLSPSDTRTDCPYKGTARYWSAAIGEQTHDDFVWSYPEPIAEAGKIAGLLAFYNEKVDLEVDGQHVERVVSRFS